MLTVVLILSSCSSQPTNETEVRQLSYVGLDLRGEDFSGRNLREADFTGAQLDGADFSNADLSYASFHDVSAVGANFSSSTLVGAFFTCCDRKVGGIFKRSDLTDANFSGSDLSAASFWAVIADGANFSSSKVSNAAFIGLRAARGVPEDVYVSLQGADFSNSDLSGTEFSEVDAEGATFSTANMSGVRLSDSSFVWADFSNAVLDSAEITRSPFTGAHLTGTSFRNSQFFLEGGGQLFDYSILESVNFDGASFDHFAFEGSRVWNSSFRNVKTKNNGIITNSDFDKVDLSGFQGPEDSPFTIRCSFVTNSVLPPLSFRDFDADYSGSSEAGTGYLFSGPYDPSCAMGTDAGQVRGQDSKLNPLVGKDFLFWNVMLRLDPAETVYPDEEAVSLAIGQMCLAYLLKKGDEASFTQGLIDLMEQQMVLGAQNRKEARLLIQMTIAGVNHCNQDTRLLYSWLRKSNALAQLEAWDSGAPAP